MSEDLKQPTRTIPRRKSFIVYQDKEKHDLEVKNKVDRLRHNGMLLSTIIEFNRAEQMREEFLSLLVSLDELTEGKKVYIKISPIEGKTLPINGVCGWDNIGGDWHGKVNELKDGEEVTGTLAWDDRRYGGEGNGPIKVEFLEEGEERYIYLTSDGVFPDFRLIDFGIMEENSDDSGKELRSVAKDLGIDLDTIPDDNNV